MENLEFINSNLQVNIRVLKTIFLILCTYYTNFRLANVKMKWDIKVLYDIVCVGCIAIICGLVRYGVNFYISIIISILMISIITFKNNLRRGLIVTSISLAINYIISFMSIALDFIIILIIKIDNNYINLLVIEFIHILLLAMVFRIRKLKYGLSFLNKTEDEYIDILILNLSVTILFLSIVFVNAKIELARNLTLEIITSIIIMFITIQKSLQLYYKHRLLIKELNETKEELEKTKKDVKELEAENLSFSKRSHTIAHKQRALEYKLQEIMNKAEISQEVVGEVQDRLKVIKQDISKKAEPIKLDKTEIPEIDDMLEYMQAECTKNNIEFELQLRGNIHHMVNHLISKEDLEILLADHIKNAIIAINHTDNVNRSILVRLGKIDKVYSLYIYDSGIEFERETLENLGKKPSTTHADEGGTGMGFMNTFDTLNKCKASLIINEIGKPSKDNYTKALIIKFDEKNEFKVTSYRPEEKIIQVVAGVIYKNNKFLIAQRNLKKDQGGLWEFPGGKLEKGETYEEALKREIKEEFKADIDVKEYIGETTHHYPEKAIKLTFYKAKLISKKIELTEHENYQWITKADKDKFEFAEADKKVFELI